MTPKAELMEGFRFSFFRLRLTGQAPLSLSSSPGHLVRIKRCHSRRGLVSDTHVMHSAAQEEADEADSRMNTVLGFYNKYTKPVQRHYQPHSSGDEHGALLEALPQVS